VDLLTIDRRDEGLVEQAVDFCGHLVSGALSGHHLTGVLLAQVDVGIVLDHRDEGASAFDDVGRMLVEKLKEIAFSRQ
jgi:hypothetical protein